LESPSCSEAGIIGYIAGIIGAMQANETIKIILDAGTVLKGKLFIINALTMDSQIAEFERNPETSRVTALGKYDELCFPENEPVSEITFDELTDLLETYPDIQLVDLRDDINTNEVRKGFIHIPYQEIQAKIGLIASEKHVVFYCDYGIKSRKVIHYLKYKKFTNKFYSLTLLKS